MPFNTTENRRVVRRQNVSMKRRQQLRCVILFLAVLFLCTLVLGRHFGTLPSSGENEPKTQRNGIIQRHSGNLRGSHGNLVWIHDDSQSFNERSLATKATHLIIVAGHSVLISGDVLNAAHDESVWFLLDYQRNRGLPQAITLHIQAGIQLALDDEESLLIFSGGETRAKTGPETEGGSYFRVADALDLWDGRDAFFESEDEGEWAGINPKHINNIGVAPKPGGSMRSHNDDQSTVRARTTTEEYATDSFENILFSICRFYEITGSYPNKISVVSFSFKRSRFENLHSLALHWPEHRFNYVGVDPPSSTGFNLKESSEGETKNSLVPFQKDPYGCHSEVLQKKRKDRNPFSRKPPYELTCPEMKDLLQWCGPDLIPKTKVPWGGS